MKRVIVVSKTHLDLGFTDFAENIRRKYIENFIPQAIELAQKVNTESKKNFVWTTGSWIIKEALRQDDKKRKVELLEAIKSGNIVAHALPFTLHSELLDADTFDYGLSVVDEIDKIRGGKTVAAKMTDVPGHTKAIVPLLAKHGIKLLHIGVNGVSAMPEVPECFLWRCGNAEVIVIYSGDYGGAYKSELIDEVLYFDHTVDNRGAPAPERVLQKLGEIQKEYPEYEVAAGTLDEYAEILWRVKDKLPVYEGEIGDTWIHGSASDPYKSACLRELMRLKKEWLRDGSMKHGSDEYSSFSDALLCIAEHTCGMDSKIALADYESYLKPDFNAARAKDKVTSKHLFREFPYNYNAEMIRTVGSYSAIEKSWLEQREYADKAVAALSKAHAEIAEKALRNLIPSEPREIDGTEYSGTVYAGGCELEINEHGGIERLCIDGKNVVQKNNNPIIEYRSYSKADYDYWFTHYSRNMDINYSWGYADFGKPLLKYADNEYPKGRFFYTAEKVTVRKEADTAEVVADLKCDDRLCSELGAPKKIRIIYTLGENGLKMSVLWYEKDVNRLPEAIFMHLYPDAEKTYLVKLGEKIDCTSVCSMGGRNLHAVEKCIFTNPAGDFEIVNRHSPLMSPGRGKILEYDNKIESIASDGVSYVMCDNAWGTNFPLWYGDNGRFDFEIRRK